MACCGQNREKMQLTRAPAKLTNPANVATLAPSSNAQSVVTGPRARLRYAGQAQIRVQGPVTRKSYVFSGAQPEAAVDRRDVEGLMRIGLFRRAV
jgi:hypothetical protein